MPQHWRVFSFVCFLAFLLVQAAAAGAATTKKKPEVKAPAAPPMVFAIVRSGVTGCEPNCPQWISAEGQIMPASAGQFRKILKQVGKQRLPVVITSQGGDVEAALAIGNMIHERKLDVVVGWTLFTGCNPTVKTCKLPKEQKGVYAGLVMTSRAYCFSACPFILAAGQKRMLGNGAILGVHEISTQPITQRIRYNETYRIVNGKKKVLSRKVVSRKNIVGKVTTKLSKPFDRKLRNYLTTMGVRVTILDLLHLAPPSSIHNLTSDEMKSTQLVTAFGNAGELVSNSLCKTTPAADNCKVEKNFVVALVPPALSKEPPSVRPAYGSPITFFIVRSSLAGCEPICPEWIYADGKITADTPALFKKILAKTENRGLPVVIRSDGGDAVAAMALGRLIRAKKLDVVVATTLFVGCPVANKDCRSAPDKKGRSRGALISNGDYCNAACTLVLAAGRKRLVEYSTTIGVQKLVPENKPESGKVTKASTAKKTEDEFQRSLGKYLDEMGVSRELLATMDKVPPMVLKNLTHSELATAKLMTEHVPIANLATNEMCKTSSPAENCKVDKNFVVAVVPQPAPPPEKIQSVHSANGSPMTFSIVRSDSPRCEPFCPEWIYAEGVITPATPGIFEWFLEKTKSGHLPIIIRSDGGHPTAAMLLGRSIRRHGMQVAVGAVHFTRCTTSKYFCRSPLDRLGNYHGTVVEANNYCNSSCILVLAGGKRRFFGSTYQIKLQKLVAEEMPAIPSALKISTKKVQEKAFQREFGKYLDDMGVDRKLIAYMGGGQNTDVYTVTIGELVAVKLATNHLHGSILMNDAVCRTSPPADYCIRR